MVFFFLLLFNGLHGFFVGFSVGNVDFDIL